MRSLLVAAAVASTGAFAQLVNPITRPTVGDILVAGTSFDITWTVTTPGELVSLILRQGPANNIGVVGPIANEIQNNGSYLWNIPTNLPSGNDYAVQIIIGPASNVSNVGPDEYNFTPLLTLVNNSTGPITNSTTTASSAASTSAASATSSGASSAAASSAGVSASTNAATTATTGATKTGTGGASGSTGSATSSATHASSAATRIEGSLMSGHGFFAFVIAVAVGVVASF